MKKTLKQIIGKLFSLPVCFLLRLLLVIAQNDLDVRKLLAGIYSLAISASHYEKMQLIRNKYEIHPTARWEINTQIYGAGRIQIGEDTYLGENCMIASNPSDVSIVIGRSCAISHNVQIRTDRYEKAPHFKQSRYEIPLKGSSISIGDYVWIGANVFIRGGVKIGNNSTVGANSVVTHDIPDNAIWGGVPARHIRWKSDTVGNEK